MKLLGQLLGSLLALALAMTYDLVAGFGRNASGRARLQPQHYRLYACHGSLRNLPYGRASELIYF